MTLLPLLFACGSPDDSDTGKVDDSGTDSETETDTDTAVDTDTATETDTDTDTGPDGDGDGYGSEVDCDDTDAAINPGATEICDEVDNDCDTLVDDDDDSLDDGTAYYDDLDGDRYGDPAAEHHSCSGTIPDGYANNGGDCDDTDAAISPNATEICDDLDTDEDCDGNADDGDSSVDPDSYIAWPVDEDGDGHGSSTNFDYSCEGVAADALDCDDSDAEISPDAEEICLNGADDDCDGTGGSCELTGELQLGSDYVLKIPGSTRNGEFGASFATQDVDGDGQEDLWVGEPGGGTDTVGQLYLFQGPIGSKLDSGSAIAIFESADEYGGMGANVRVADLDGDGAEDLISGGAGSSNYEGAVSIFSGSLLAGGDSASAFATIDGSSTRGYFGVHGLVVDDLDGDGAADLAAWDEVDAAFRIFPGPLSEGAWLGSDAEHSISTPSMSYPDAGNGLLAAGDIDGDGLPELALGIPNDSTTQPGEGRVWVLEGGTTSGSFADDAMVTFVGATSNDYVGSTIVLDGDADGDGSNDVLIGAPNYNNGTVYVFTSELSGEQSVSVADATLTGADSEYLGNGLGWAGDLDNDGVADLAVGATKYNGSSRTAGRVLYWFGPVTASETSADADFSAVGEGESDACGTPVGGGSDLTGDGMADGLLTCSGNGGGSGAVWVIAGGGL